jgi:large repetitive protein
MRSAVVLNLIRGVAVKKAIAVRVLCAASLLGMALLSLATPLCAQTASFSGLQIASGLNSPAGIAVSGAGPEAGDVYVANLGSGTVSVINPANNSVVATVTVGTAPPGIAVIGAGPEAGDVYVANKGDNTVSVINPVTNTVTATINVGIKPAAVAVSPIGTGVYVANKGDSTVSVINPATNTVTATISVGTEPVAIALNGTGTDVYVANKGDNTVSVINPVTNTVTATIPVGTEPVAIALNGTGTDVYVANKGDNTVSVINPVTNTVTATIPVGTEPVAIAVDGSGKVFVADTASGNVLKETLSGVNFGSVAVATTTPPTLTLQFTFTAAGAIGAPAVLTQGAANKDFTDAGTGTCTTNGTADAYAAGDTCTVVVSFTPAHPGPRYGAVELLNTAGTAVIASANVFGTGTGPQITFGPGMQSTLGSGFSMPSGVAVDGSGNVFVADIGNSTVKEILAVNGVVSSSSMVTTLGSGFSDPFGVAVDGSGNVFVADRNNHAVKEILAVNGSIPASNPTINTLGSGFSLPFGVAVDGSGNVFVADDGNDAVKEILAVNGSIPASNPTINTLGSGFSFPTGVVVDGSGNVFVADDGNNAVKEILAVNGVVSSSSMVNMLGSGFSGPSGVAVDGSGNVFVADTFNNAVKEILAVNGVVSSSSMVNTLGSGFNEPSGVAVDGSGSVFVADTFNSHVEKLDYADPPTLTFATATDDGTTDTTDGALSVTITNDGNEPLMAVSPGLSVAANFTQVDGSGTLTDCTASFSLAEDASCNLSIEFAPVAPDNGAVNGSVTLTDNNLNATTSTMQRIPLMGTAVEVTPTAANSILALPATALAGATVTGTLTLKDQDGNLVLPTSVTFTTTSTTTTFSTPTTVTTASGVATISFSDTKAETVMIGVNVGGTAFLSGTVQITPAVPASVSVVSGTPQSATVNTQFAAPLVVVIADKYGNPTPNVAVPSFGVPATGASAILTTVAETNSNGQANVTATANGTSGSYNVTVTEQNATATFALTNNAATQTITFTQPVSPVTYGVAPITLVASASSQLPVTFAVTGPATVNGSILTITGAGMVGINARQAGNPTFVAATSVMRSLAVNQQPTVTSVSASASAASPVQTVTLTATVAATIAGTPTMPSGTVTFFDNGTALMSEPVTAGVAQLTTLLPAGATAVITATYSGNGNFLASSSGNSATVMVASLDFTFTNTGASAFTAAPGAVASYSFGLSPLSGSYAGPVNFTVTGLPAGATASFTPSSVAVDGGATPVVMTVQTASATAHNRNPFSRGIVLALLLLPFVSKRSVREKLNGRMLLMLLLMGGLTATLTGCGAPTGSLLQSPQTYTLTVTAASGTLQHTQTVTLTVK